MDKVKFAGEVKLESCIIKTMTSKKSIDVKNQLLAINIYEDIFSPFITGSLSIKDSVDLANALPFSGEEILSLKISTPGYKDAILNMDFYIYKMSDREYVNERSVIYSLAFISKEAIVDINKKISKAFSGNISKIISELVNSATGLESTKKVTTEQINDGIKYVSNYWSPIKNLEFLVRNTNNINGSPSFLFYENRSGFNYLSLDTLYRLPAKTEFNYSNFTRKNTSSGSVKNIELDYARIIDISVPKVFDYLEDIASGKYAAKTIEYDLTTKRFKISAYDFTKRYNRQNHLNSFSSTSGKVIKRFNSKIDVGTTSFDVHTGFGKSTYDNIDSMERQSLLMQSRSNVVNVTVPGRIDYTVGQKVVLKIYKVEPIKASETEDDVLDKLLSGNYIISAINHTISNTEHECNMELIKDSILFDLGKGN